MTPAVQRNNQTSDTSRNLQGFSNNEPVSLNLPETPIEHEPSYKLAPLKMFNSSTNAKQAAEDDKSEGILENLDAENAFIAERELELKAIEAQLKRDNWVECRSLFNASQSTCHFKAEEFTIPSKEEIEIEKSTSQNLNEKNPADKTQ